MRTRCALLALAVTTLAGTAAAATPLEAVPEAEPGVNIVALAWGRIPDHAGSNEGVSGIAPLVWLKLAGGRWLQLDRRLAISPIVSERGARSSAIIGVGAGYVWR